VQVAFESIVLIVFAFVAAHGVEHGCSSTPRGGCGAAPASESEMPKCKKMDLHGSGQDGVEMIGSVGTF